MLSVVRFTKIVISGGVYKNCHQWWGLQKLSSVVGFTKIVISGGVYKNCHQYQWWGLQELSVVVFTRIESITTTR